MIIPAILLSILSVVIIYSTSSDQASQVLAAQQALYAGAGLLIYFGLRTYDYRSLGYFIKPAYLTMLLLLVVVFLLGVETRGSLRWIPLGPLHIQPSEFAKPVLILALANFWSKHRSTWLNIAKSLGILLPMAVLVFKQPDLGTTLTLGFIWLVLLLASNISFFKLGTMTLVAAAAAPLGWFSLHTYQRERFLSFLDPSRDLLGTNYNVNQSMIAVGSGELIGRGLGRGTQSRLQFLPEFRTDFIFASMAEELGLIGVLITLCLYLLIFFFLFKILMRLKDRLGELIIIGVSSMLFIQIVINMGMNMGIFPITGITLPLMSYGGSSVLTIFASLGLAASVDKFNPRRLKPIQTVEFA